MRTMTDPWKPGKKHWPDLRGLRLPNHDPFGAVDNFYFCKKHWPDLRGLRHCKIGYSLFLSSLSYVRNIDPIWGDCDFPNSQNRSFEQYFFVRNIDPIWGDCDHQWEQHQFQNNYKVRNIDPIWGDCDFHKQFSLVRPLHVRNIDPIWGDCDKKTQFIHFILTSFLLHVRNIDPIWGDCDRDRATALCIASNGR